MQPAVRATLRLPGQAAEAFVPREGSLLAQLAAARDEVNARLTAALPGVPARKDAGMLSHLRL
jgi:hypothetical protein